MHATTPVRLMIRSPAGIPRKRLLRAVIRPVIGEPDRECSGPSSCRAGEGWSSPQRNRPEPCITALMMHDLIQDGRSNRRAIGGPDDAASTASSAPGERERAPPGSRRAIVSPGQSTGDRGDEDAWMHDGPSVPRTGKGIAQSVIGGTVAL